MKTDLFQSCGHCWVFQICWHIECSIFPASSFRIWNSSSGIPSPPLALFTVMLLKAHLTSHSRMSGSRWVITPCGYLGYEDLFCTVLLRDSCHLFLISSASVRSISVLYCAHLCMKCSLCNSNFLEEISVVFPILLFSSISLHWSLRKAFLSLLAILWNSAFKWSGPNQSPLPTFMEGLGSSSGLCRWAQWVAGKADSPLGRSTQLFLSWQGCSSSAHLTQQLRAGSGVERSWG